MAEVLAAVALALASGAFVLAAFAWTRADGARLGRPAPARAAGTPSPAAADAPALARSALPPPYATDPLVLLRLDALERRLVDESAARTLEDGVPAARPAEATSTEAPAAPAARAARAGWRAFP